MTIAKRLMILLGVPLLVLVGLGVLLRYEVANIESRSRFVTEVQTPSLAALGGISRSFIPMELVISTSTPRCLAQAS